MKVICLQENLKTNLNIVQNIIGRNLTLPILNNLLLETEGGRLKISSTNLEIGINTWTTGKVETTGAITCPAKILASFVSSLPNKKVELEAKNNVLTVRCEGYKATIKCLSAEDYPIIPKLKEDPLAIGEIRTFRDGLSQVAGLAAISESRPEITGIFFGFEKYDLRLAATDSFRLGEKIVARIQKKNSDIASFILPQRTAQELIRVFGEREGELKIVMGSSQIMFEGGDVQVVSRLIEGQYPPYQQIIPKSLGTQIALSKDELVNNIRVAGLFSSRINDVLFSVQSKGLEILSQDSDLGANKSQMEADVKGKTGFEVKFNFRYLLDGLANIGAKQVMFGLNADSGPAVIKPIGDESYLYVVMPIKNN